MAERNPEIRKPEPILPLFEQAHVRNSDGIHSHRAAASVRMENLGPTRDNILRIIQQWGPVTDEEISGHYALGFLPLSTPSGLRSRRAELVRMGFVEAHPTLVGITAAGRNCAVWRLKR